MPLDTSRDQLYFNEGAFAYAGYHRHARVQPLHTHSFMEVAFVIGGAALVTAAVLWKHSIAITPTSHGGLVGWARAY